MKRFGCAHGPGTGERRPFSAMICELWAEASNRQHQVEPSQHAPAEPTPAILSTEPRSWPNSAHLLPRARTVPPRRQMREEVAENGSSPLLSRLSKRGKSYPTARSGAVERMDAQPSPASTFAWYSSRFRKPASSAAAWSAGDRVSCTTGRRFHSASGAVPSSFGTYREVSTRAYLCT